MSLKQIRLKDSSKSCFFLQFNKRALLTNVCILKRGLEEYVYFEFYQNFSGWSENEQARRKMLIGENSISIKVTPILVLIFHEVKRCSFCLQIAQF